MLVLKLLKQIHLPLLITGRLPHLLLSLIKHHLLHHRPRLTIQVTQRRILGCDLCDVDFGCAGHDVRPPFHLIDFVEVDSHLFARGDGFEHPCRVVCVNRVREVALFS